MKRPPNVVRPLLEGAGPPLLPIPPRPNALLLGLIPVIAPLYRRFVLKMRPIRSDTGALREILDDPAALTFVAFRHPSADDAQIVYQTIRRAVAGPIFLYGRGIPVWSGALTGWVLPRIGAFSVFPGTVNRQSMMILKQALGSLSGPICLAPEAQVTYHNYRVAPIQRGTAALALDAATDHPERTVRILPLGLEFRYPDRSGRTARRLLTRAERRLGIDPPRGGAPSPPVDRLWRVLGEIMRLVIASAGGARNTAVDTVQESQSRVVHALDIALSTAERLFNLEPGQGDSVGRVFRIRARFWEKAYPHHRVAGPIGNQIHDINAVEARIAARWLEIADVLSYVDMTYLAGVGLVPGAALPAAGSSRHARFVEYLLMADDLLGRIVGGSIAGRRRWPGRTCTIRQGAVREVFATPSRRSAITELTSWLSDQLTLLSRSSTETE